MDTILADLRHAVRTLRRSPAFTLSALATLAIGIGATASIFSVVNGVLLRPLPLIAPERLTTIRANQLEQGWLGITLAGPDFATLRAESRAHEHLAAITMRNVDVTGRGDPAEVTAAVVSRDFFSVMPVTPLLGRTFVADEHAAGQPQSNIVIMGEGLWRLRYGADPSVLGTAMIVNGTPRTIVGIVPAATSWPRPAGSPDLFFPLPEVFDQLGRGNHMFEVLGRLRPDATIAQARAELAAINARLARDFPETNAKWTLTADPLVDVVVGGARRPLYVLLGAVSFVLLIVCANVASLLVARAAARNHELAIRRALGASHGRITRHLAAEAVLLSAGGGLLGALSALWGVDLLRTMGPGGLPRLGEVTVDGRVLLFTAGVAAMTGIICAILPAVQGAGPRLQAVLKEGGRAAVAGHGSRGRGLLVVGEIALALVLLAGAGLMIRSFSEMRRLPLGFDPTNVIAIDLDLPQAQYGEPAKRDDIIKRVEEQVRAVPGVIAVGTTRALPLESGGPNAEFTIDGRPPVPPGETGPGSYYTAVTPGYFRTMGMQVVRGRGLEESDDRQAAAQVAVINETMARRYWAGENPIGHRLTFSDGRKVEIVGVVRDVRQRFLTNPVEPQMFVAWAQAPELQVSMVVRTTPDPLALVDELNGAVWAVDPLLPVEQWTLRSLLSDSLAGSRFQTRLLFGFAAIALLLAAMGVYALVSYAVMQRTREIGVRMALGAGQRDVVRMVLRQGARLTVAGVALGLAGAFLLTETMRGFLFGVSPGDPVTHVGAALLLATIAVLATYLPARRAASVDPLVALRHE